MWEAVTALATLGTGVAIVLTVLLGVRQLRVTSDQLEALRKATQLEGTMKIFDDLFEEQLFQAMKFVSDELPSRMLEPEFRAGLPLIQHGDPAHPELVVMRYFERVGTYVKNGLVDGAIIYDLMVIRIVDLWESLEGVAAIHRAARGDGLWENFEFLYRDGRRWMNEMRSEGFTRK
jgi:hypothetical protein